MQTETFRMPAPLRTGLDPYKRCACGRSFTRERWQALPRIGEFADAVERCDLRHCPCGSTISVGTLRTRVSYAIVTVGDGFLVWRRAGSGEHVPVGTGAQVTTFRNMAEAEAAILMEERMDKMAARRLGLELVEGEEPSE